MIVKDLMSEDVHTCGPEDSLQHAAQIMWDQDCGTVPVIDIDRRVVGMLTDRDVCMHAMMSGRRLQDCTVADAMASDVFTCGPSDSLDAAQSLMRRQRVRRLPVTDAAQRLVGILSLNDLALHVGRDSRESGVPPEALAATLTGISVHGQPQGA
jgi:CBS-domain-containing membrane protein